MFFIGEALSKSWSVNCSKVHSDSTRKKYANMHDETSITEQMGHLVIVELSESALVELFYSSYLSLTLKHA
jgi:hypothetical protein